MSKHNSKVFRGTASPLVSGDSLFEWLIDDSADDASETTYETISSVEEIIIYGGDKAGATAEYPCDSDAHADKIFDLLSLDLAVIFPENFDKKNEKILGRQFCLCRTNEISEAPWYKRALKNYFEMSPGGSLLNYSEVQKNRNQWWLSFPPENLQRGATAIKNQLDENEPPKIWKDKFEPRLSENSGIKFDERFEQFGASVFGELSGLYDDSILKSCSLLWIYIGLSEEEEKFKPAADKTILRINLANPKNRQNRQNSKKSLWGVSLFAVIKPASIPVNCEHWTENSKLSSSLRKAVDQLYLYLEAEGYKTIQRRRLEEEKKAIQLNIGQAIAHEFKNLTNEVSVLGNNVSNKFKSVSITAQHHLGANSEISQQISRLSEELIRLSRISSFLSPISLATFWLTTADPDEEIEFIADPGCEICKAVTYFALDMCRATKADWVIEDYDLDESISLIKKAYQVENLDDLADRIDFALLLFVVNEPIRNIRSVGSERKVKIKVEVRGNSLYLCQETLERKETFEPIPSRAVQRINRLLQEAEGLLQMQETGGLSQSFIHINEQTVTTGCVKQADGMYKVKRETQIKIFKVPIQK